MRNKLLVSNTHHSKKQNKTKTNKQRKQVLYRATLTLNQGKQVLSQKALNLTHHLKKKHFSHCLNGNNSS